MAHVTEAGIENAVIATASRLARVLVDQSLHPGSSLRVGARDATIAALTNISNVIAKNLMR